MSSNPPSIQVNVSKYYSVLGVNDKCRLQLLFQLTDRTRSPQHGVAGHVNFNRR